MSSTFHSFLGVLAIVASLAGCDGAVGQPPVEEPPPLRPAMPVRLSTAPGSAAVPLPIAVFPFTHRGDTAVDGEMEIARYDCAPAISQTGPEVHYEVVLPHPGTLRAAVEGDIGVDVDVHLLAALDATCLARGDRRIAVGLDAGTYRLVVDTHGLPGPYQLNVTLEPPRAVELGTLWNTYYYLANERDHLGERRDTPLLGGDCDILADVSRKFHDDLCIEGSGILRDGRVLNYSRTCTRRCYAAVRCRRYRYKICYRELDAQRYPWGMGVGGRPLEPDVSIAVDTDLVPAGTVIYLAELDGVVPPGATEPHDGCVRADDIGGAIKDVHIDIFSGTRARWRAWEKIFRTRSEFTAYLYHPRCYGMPGSAVP